MKKKGNIHFLGKKRYVVVFFWRMFAKQKNEIRILFYFIVRAEIFAVTEVVSI